MTRMRELSSDSKPAYWRSLIKYTGALLLIALSVSTSACSEKRQVVTLRVIGEGYPPLLAFEQVKGSFEKETGIRVEVNKRDHMAVVAEMDREFSSGNVTYDLAIVPHRLLGKYVA